MKKFLIVFIATLFLLPSVALAGRHYHGDKYKVYKNKHPRTHKSDRHKPKHPNFKRGHIYKYHGQDRHYRHHYSWKQWYDEGVRYKYPNGRYERRDGGVMTFSYCTGPLCFFYTLDDNVLDK